MNMVYLKILEILADSDIGNTVGIIGDFIGALAIIIPILFSAAVLIFNQVRRKNIFISKVLVRQNDAKLRKAEKLRFKVYRNPTIRIGKEQYTYYNFRKKIIDKNACVFVHAPSGYGKSLLMKRLAYDYSKKFAIRRIKKETDLGICFISADSSKSSDYIIKKLDEIENTNNISVFIDGLDRIKDFSSDKSSDVNNCLNLIFNKVSEKDFKRLVLSFRTELWTEKMSSMSSYSLGSGEYKSEAVIARIIKFSAKDVVKVLKGYLSKSKLCEDYLATSKRKLSFKEKKNIYKKLSDLLEKDRNSLLSIPFFIPFVPLIFSNSDNLEPSRLTKFDIIKYVTEQFFARELKNSRQNGEVTDKAEYTASGINTLLALVREMNESGLSYADKGVSADRLKETGIDINIGNFASRNILKCSASSGNGSSFEFLHQNFYEYFLCRIIIDDINNPETPYERLSEYYNFIANADKTSAPFKELFYQAVYSEHKNSLQYASFKDFYGNLTGNLGAEFNNCELKLDRLLLMLPSIKRLTYNGFVFNGDSIATLAKLRKLLVHTDDKDAVNYPDYISDGYLTALEITGHNFKYDSDFEALLNKTAVRRLTVQTDSRTALSKLLKADVDTLILNISNYSLLYPEIYRILRNNETEKELLIKKPSEDIDLAEKYSAEHLKAVFYVDYKLFPYSGSLEAIAAELTEKLCIMLFSDSEIKQAGEIIFEIKPELNDFAKRINFNRANNYGMCLYKLSEYEQALPLLKAEYEWYKKQGIDDVFANDRRFWYGCCLYELNEYEQALPLLKAAYEWYKKPGNDDVFANDRRFQYGCCLFEIKGCEQEGLNHIIEVYNKQKMIKDIDSVKFYGTECFDCLKRLGRDDEAEKLQEDMKEVLKTRFGVEE